jgi:hypothetical protein
MVTSVGAEEFFQTHEEREAEEVRQAARVIKDACNRRMSGESCSSCPFYDICIPRHILGRYDVHRIPQTKGGEKMQKNKKLTRILCAILALTLILSIIGSLC